MSCVWAGFTEDKDISGTTDIYSIKRVARVARKRDMTDMIKIAECSYAIYHHKLKSIFKAEDIHIMHRRNGILVDAEKSSKPDEYYHGFIYVHVSCVERVKEILDNNNIEDIDIIAPITKTFLLMTMLIRFFAYIKNIWQKKVKPFFISI